MRFLSVPASLQLALLFFMAGVAPATAEIAVGGRVTADGRPAEGARIELRPTLDQHATGEHRLAGTVPESVAASETDANGLFRLTAPDVGFYSVHVSLDGHVPRERLLTPLLFDIDLPTVDLVEDDGLDLRLTSSGKPIQGWVVAFPVDSAARAVTGRASRARSRDGWRSPIHVAQSDEDGLATVPASRKDLTWFAQAKASDVAPADREATARRRLDIKLVEGRPQRVLVVDERGTPVAGAVIFTTPAHLPLARTDERGQTQVFVPQTGLTLRANDDQGRQGAARLEGEPETRSEIVRLVLATPRSVTGRVIEKGTRLPLAGALVWTGNGRDSTTTAKDGSYAIPIRDLGSRELRTLRAAAVAYAVDTASASSAAEGPTLVLAPAAVLAGRAVDADEKPLAGVEIEISQIATPRRARFFSGRGFETRWARTQANGRFRIAGLPAERGYQLDLVKPGFAPAVLKAENLEPFEERTDLRAILMRGSRALGLILDEEDQPVSGATVRLTEPPDPRNRFVEPAGDDDAPSAVSDGEGNFQIVDLAAGQFSLEVAAAGFGSVTVPGIEIPEGAQEVDLGTVVLPPGAVIEGHVVSATGPPLANIEIHATPPSRFPLPAAFQRMQLAQIPPDAITGADGRFAIVDRRAGEKLDLTLAGTGYVPQTVSGVETPSSEPLEIVLQPAARVSGRVVDAQSEPIAEAVIVGSSEGAGGSGRRAMSGFNRTTSDSEGRFVLVDVKPGALGLAARADGFRETTISGLQAPAGGELSDVELVLQTGATVTGTLLDAADVPVAGAWISISETGGARGQREAFSETDGDGRFRLTGIGLGKRTVSAREEGPRQVSKSLDVVAGTQSIELRFSGGAQLSGTVLDIAGAAVPGAMVTLSRSSGRRFSSTAESESDAQGRYTLSDVAPGTYYLRAGKEGFATTVGDQPIEVATSNLDGLDIRLDEGATLSGRVLGLDIDDLAKVEVRALRSPVGVDFEGRYSIANLSPGEITVSAEIPGSGRQVSERIVIEEGATTAYLDLEFGGGFTVEGSVWFGENPLAGTSVDLWGTSVQSRARAVTDRNGKFRAEGLEEGQYTLRIRDLESGIEHSEDLEVPTDGEIRVDVGSGRIAGVVRDRSDSSVLEGVQITLDAVDSPTPRWLGKRSTSDSEGRYVLGAVPEGSWKVRAAKAGYADFETSFQLAPNEQRDGFDLLLSPAADLSLVVEMATGAPPRRIAAAVLDPAGQRIAGGTYEALEGGRVEITTVPAGVWELLISADGSAVTSLSVTAPGDAGRIRLKPGGSLKVTVPDLAAEGTPANLTLLDGSGRQHRRIRWGGTVLTDQALRNGGATIDQLEPGTWRIQVTAQDGRTWTSTATVEANTTSEVTIH